MLLTLAVYLGPAALHAQSTTQGAISGTVMDSSGAVIPAASVTIQNKATNFTVKLAADASGSFYAPLLEPGNYTVSIMASNFAGYRADNVVVVVGQVTSLLPHLAVAASTSEVVVTEQTPIMNLSSPDFTDTLNSTALQNIPINNRRWSSLAMTTPGAVSDSTGYGYVSVRGIQYTLNNVEIDGADDNNEFYAEERGRTREAYSTSGAAVREFAVNTGVYSAEYGRAAGGVITSVTKSGTNQLHGQAYFWDRESNWNAFNDYSTITTASGATEHFKPEDLRKIYGFTAGGPLIKDKLFWIYTYDQHSHIFPVAIVPYSQSIFNAMPSLPTGTTLTQRNPVTPAGESCSLSGSTLGELVNTGTAVAYTGTPGSLNDADVCELAARQGVSYNQAAYDWTVMMLGNATVGAPPAGVAAITDLGLTSDMGTVPRAGYQEINMPKIDWQIDPKEHASFLYNRLRWDSPGGVQTNPVDEDAIDYQGNDFVKVDYGVGKLTSLITSNISNEVLYQYSRELLDESNQKPSAYSKEDITSLTGATPMIAASYYDGIDAGAPYYGFEKALPDEAKWQFGDTLYWNKGNHSFKFGVDMLHTYDMQNYLKYNEGYFNYDYFGNYFNDLLNFKNGVTPSGSGYGSKGCNSTGYENGTGATGTYPCYYQYTQALGTPNFAIATTDYGFFGQDNWKFSPRLTLELGLRWDYQALPPPISNLTTAATNNGITFVPYTVNGSQPLLNAPSDKANFGPRVGFSWDVYGGGTTVLRGGYGLYFGRIPNGALMGERIGTGSPYGQITPVWAEKTAGAPIYPNILAGNSNAITPTSNFFAPNLHSPEVQEFDMALQQAMGHGTFFQLSYLGALGRHLPNFLNLNLNPATMVTDTVTISDASGLGPLHNGATFQVPVYFYASTNSGYGAGNTNLFGAAGADYTSISEMISNVNSSYQALVVEVMNRTLKSIQFDANYTWSHDLDFAQNNATGTAVNDWYDPFSNARVNYGNGSTNVPNRFVAYALYNFPNLHTENYAKYVANGWSLNTSFQMQNGLPFTAGITGTWSNALTSGWNGSGGSSIIPMLGRDTLQYPRKIVDDMRLQKDVSFDRGYSLQLMLNAFNVANHQNVDGFVTTNAYSIKGYVATYQGQVGTTNSGFAVPNSSNNSSFLYTPRQVEIAARFNF
jgi:outer membrane receptor protein involved in Fe transport